MTTLDTLPLVDFEDVTYLDDQEIYRDSNCYRLELPDGRMLTATVHAPNVNIPSIVCGRTKEYAESLRLLAPNSQIKINPLDNTHMLKEGLITQKNLMSLLGNDYWAIAYPI